MHTDLISSVIAGLQRAKLLSERDHILSKWSYRAAHGYPTPFLGRNVVLEQLRGELEPLGIYSRGRFGGWKYEVSNQDHTFMQGVEWAQRMCQGTPEQTLDHPEQVNATRQK